MTMQKHISFNGNTLKIFALILMTIDHIGAYLLPEWNFLRIIGRLSFPIFAFMIAQGCTYTKNRRAYLFKMLLLAFIYQSTLYVVSRSLNMCIIVTFSLSILMIYATDKMFSTRRTIDFIMCLLLLLIIYFISEMLPRGLENTDYGIDYGFFGIMTPLFIFLGKKHSHRLLMTALGLILLSAHYGQIQWFCLLSLIPLYFYNGERGTAKLKNFFYIYYPLHLVIIYIIGLFI